MAIIITRETARRSFDDVTSNARIVTNNRVKNGHRTKRHVCIIYACVCLMYVHRMLRHIARLES